MEHSTSLSYGGDGLLRIVPTGEPVTFRLVGELDASDAPATCERLAALLRSNHSLILDLSGLSFMDCAGLRVFLRLGEMASSMDRSTVALAHRARIVRKIFEIGAPTGISGIEFLD